MGLCYDMSHTPVPEAALGTLDGHCLLSPYHLPAWLRLHSYSFREEAGAHGKGLAHLTSAPGPCLLLGAVVTNVLMSYHVPLSQVGFINSLKFSSAGDFLVAGVGQEHRYVMGVGPRAG